MFCCQLFLFSCLVLQQLPLHTSFGIFTCKLCLHLWANLLRSSKPEPCFAAALIAALAIMILLVELWWWLTWCRKDENKCVFTLLVSKTIASKPSTGGGRGGGERNQTQSITVKPLSAGRLIEAVCLFRLEYALKSEDQGLVLQRATRIYGIDCKSESATWTS